MPFEDFKPEPQSELELEPEAETHPEDKVLSESEPVSETEKYLNPATSNEETEEQTTALHTLSLLDLAECLGREKLMWVACRIQSFPIPEQLFGNH